MATLQEIEKAARMMNDGERWAIWNGCGAHRWTTLRQVVSGERYCPDCCTIWTPDGAIDNAPVRPVAGER